MIKITRFDSSSPEEWIILVNLVQKSFVGQNVTTSLPIDKSMERVLKGHQEEIPQLSDKFLKHADKCM